MILRLFWRKIIKMANFKWGKLFKPVHEFAHLVFSVSLLNSKFNVDYDFAIKFDSIQ